MILHLSVCSQLKELLDGFISLFFVYFWSWSLQNTHAKHKCLSLCRPVPRGTRCRLCCTFLSPSVPPRPTHGPVWTRLERAACSLTDIRFIFLHFHLHSCWRRKCRELAALSSVCSLFLQKARHFLCVSSPQTLIESISLKGTFLIS